MLNTLLLLATVSGPSRPVVKPIMTSNHWYRHKNKKGKVKKNKKTQNIEDELIVVISVDS